MSETLNPIFFHHELHERRDPRNARDIAASAIESAGPAPSWGALLPAVGLGCSGALATVALVLWLVGDPGPALPAGLALMLAAASLALRRRQRLASRHHAEACSARPERLPLEIERYGLARLVTNAMEDGAYLIDAQSQVLFVNQPAADRTGLSPEALNGAPLEALLGPEDARSCRRLAAAALETGRRQEHLVTRLRGGCRSEQRVRYLPVAAGPSGSAAVLVLERDISAEMAAERARLRTFDGLIDACLALVDLRDPLSAHRARCLARLSGALATALDLPPALCGAVRKAAVLRSLAMATIPHQLFESGGRLLEPTTRHCHVPSEEIAALVLGLDCAEPVAETLTQCEERFDGRGRPRGLKGREILASARVLRVAEDFLELAGVNPPAGHPAIARALAQLDAQSQRLYDGDVILALHRHIAEHCEQEVD